MIAITGWALKPSQLSAQERYCSNNQLLLHGLLLSALLLLSGCGSTPKHDTETIPDGIEQQTWDRVNEWNELIRSGGAWDEERRLVEVNNFINKLAFVDDIDHWGVEDYWATPLETLVSGGGDCEDFSFAKYFTLQSMGVNTAKLRMTYVKAYTLDQPHMVVSYFPTPNAVPLVLDNINPQILPATVRPDLVPVYSFNSDGLWLAKRSGVERYVNKSDQLSLWNRLLSRLDAEAAERDNNICRYQYFKLSPTEAAARCPK